MAKHNKKRNVGLIHEQLIRYISECMVAGNQDEADVAISILERHFNKDSELYREFRLFHSLIHTKIESPETARKIIAESRIASKNHDSVKLDKEKSLLIKDINHSVNETNFYGKKMVSYKVYATVQALLNEWRGRGQLFPDEVVKYETVLESWLTRDEQNQGIKDNPDANPFVLKLMINKFNSKYGDALNERQVSLLSAKLKNDQSAVVDKINEIRDSGISALNNFYETCDNKFLLSKKEDVTSRVKNMGAGTSDLVVERALSLAALIEELESNDE